MSISRFPASVVAIKSAWWSKINWTQVVGAAASILVIATGGKVNLSPEMQLAIVAVIQTVQSLVTIVMKTWFTSTVTESSISGVAPKGTAVVVDGNVVTGHFEKAA